MLEAHTPSYGNGERLEYIKKASIDEGDVANETALCMPMHLGTHVDMPLHFYDEGQDIRNFDASFWVFANPLVVEVTPRDLLIEQELIARLELVEAKSDTDLLLVKTGAESYRHQRDYWESNPGFSAEVYRYLSVHFPALRVMGFDTISVTSFAHPLAGREAHRAFLNPARPLLLLEDMHLADIDEQTRFGQIVVVPLRVENSDGLPCTVLATVESQ
jgi:arylformamidase